MSWIKMKVSVSDLSFVIRTAWRDARRERGLLLMFMSSIILGITALVAINAFNDALVADVDRQAATLLGADLELSSNDPIPPDVLELVDSVVTERATEVELLSMAYFSSVDESQFVRVKAVEGNFPWYGKILAEPESSVKGIQNHRSAVVDVNLLKEHGLEVGDSVKLGQVSFEITGQLERAFGSAGVGGSFAPVIYIGLQEMEATKLIQPGSLVDHDMFFLTREGLKIDEFVERHKPFFRERSVRTETIESQKEDVNEAFESFNSFLNLVALVALLLGCIGVSSSIFVYVRRKTKTIAIFRCLGMTGRQALSVFLAQILTLGFISISAGIIIGSFVQVALPVVMADFLPLEVHVGFSWSAMWEGLIIGLVLTTLFALWPLLGVRKVEPLRVLRDIGMQGAGAGDPWVKVVIGSIVLSVGLTLWYLTNDLENALSLLGGLIVAFLVLYGLSRILGWLIRTKVPSGLAFVWRQGMANLHRPNNQSSTLIITLGLGTGILATLFIVQALLINNIERMDAGNQPNMILFGIETEQKDSLEALTESFDMPVIQQVPIVTMRLTEWQGRTKEAWLKDTTRAAESWVIHREARVTYRDTLDESEELVEGRFVGSAGPGDSIFISLSDGFAEALAVDIGDEIVFNVQGARVKTYVSSIRRIDFSTMQARFFIVFPTGVLEAAPQFHVLVTKSSGSSATAKYRTAVVRKFPNISVVDLASILETVNEIFKKISYVVQFMAAFSILTGLLVLISSLWLSRYQRIRENALLRTLGASSRQLLSINAMEYAWIGALSAFSGLLLAVGASFAIATFQLEMDYVINWWSLVLIFLGVTIMTVLIGIWNTRHVLRASPVEVLR